MLKMAAWKKNSPELASSSPAEQLEQNEAIVPEKPSNENLFERPSSARLKKSLFVPIKERKAPKSKDSAQTEEFSGLMGQIKTVLEGDNNSVQQILSFFEKENEKAGEHELWLFQMIFPQQTSIPKSTCYIQIQPAPHRQLCQVTLLKQNTCTIYLHLIQMMSLAHSEIKASGKLILCPTQLL